MYIAWIEADIRWGTKDNPTGLKDWEANDDSSGELEEILGEKKSERSNA